MSDVPQTSMVSTVSSSPMKICPQITTDPFGERVLIRAMRLRESVASLTLKALLIPPVLPFGDKALIRAREILFIMTRALIRARESFSFMNKAIIMAMVSLDILPIQPTESGSGYLVRGPPPNDP